jgi:hypothetical protein
MSTNPKTNWLLKLITLCLLVAAGSALLIRSSALAASKSPTGITISPAFQQITILPDEAERPLQLRITNNQTQLITLAVSSADFNSLSDTGGLFFVGANPTDLQKKYGLAKWINFPSSSLALSPHQTTTINASILNQPDLAPGGHYGAVMLSIASGNGAGGTNKIAIHPIASSLLFVNKVGGDIHKLNLTSVSLSHRPFSLPSSVTLRFHNDGNTHLYPRGVINVTDPKGKIVSKGVINQDSNPILPETFRLYTVPLTKLKSPVLPGRYKLTVNYRFDGYDQLRTYQTSFIVFSFGSFIIIMMAATAIGAVIYYGRFDSKKLKNIRPKIKAQF